MNGPTIPHGDELWFAAEARLLGVVERAMALMRSSDMPLPPLEDGISRKLALRMRDANEKLRVENRHIEHLPMLQCKTQPDAETEVAEEPERKIPDFQWQYVDLQESDSQKKYKHYHIECKRLRSPKSRFCREYVTKGICRFRDAAHSYGQYLPSGSMLGYIQGMDPETLLTAINEEVQKEGLTQLCLSVGGWHPGGTSRLDHTFDRPQVPPSPFQLRHFWVDIRTDSGSTSEDDE